MKNFIKRPDFPLFLLGGFIMLLLLFILVRLPGAKIEPKKTSALGKTQIEELKKALDDIRNEIVEIRYGLAGEEDGSTTEFTTALNRLEERFDKRLINIEKELKKITKPRKISNTDNASAVKVKADRKYSNKKPAAKKKEKVKAVKKKSLFHIVKKGDTLYQIAKKYNVSIADIKKWNKMKNTSIHPGEKILIKR